MRDTHTEHLRIFCKVMGVKKYLIQHIFAAIDEAHIVDIRYRTKNSIKMSVPDLPTYLQYTYGQITPHKILEQK